MPVQYRKSKKRRLVRLLAAGILLAALYVALSYFHLLPQRSYTGEDFGIERAVSENDRNRNGVDDYADILLGARADARNRPAYKSAYYEGGYPPEDEGVCTDLVWRAFSHAGYSLKDMVDEDIKANTEAYPRVEGKPDPNIDFRRVPNLKVFFDRHAESLTLDPYVIDQWQPGDIVIFGENFSHIAIVSDKRNKKGIPYIIHNAGQPVREEDSLMRGHDSQKITGHYRFSYSDEQQVV